MNQSLLNEYEELLLQRDQLLLDADQIELQYVQAFGEARKNLFEEQIACIRCKKALAWYQQAHNHGLSVDPGQLKDYLDREMLSYQLQLSRMIRDNEAAADTRAVTPYEERRSRSLYRILARKLHPDMHPGLMGDDLLSGLWLRISAAYHNFDVKALTELTVLSGSHVLRSPGNLLGGSVNVDINSSRQLALDILGRDNDNTISTAGTVDSGSGTILQHVD